MARGCSSLIYFDKCCVTNLFQEQLETIMLYGTICPGQRVYFHRENKDRLFDDIIVYVVK
jgi:hypothetical protein